MAGKNLLLELLLPMVLLVPSVCVAQQVASRDPQAFAILRQSIAAMGGTVPADSRATGSIATDAGSLGETGTVTILTRGTNQTAEQVSTPGASTVVYSQGVASILKESRISSLSVELTATAQSVYFPLPLLVGLLNNPVSACSYVGMESLNGRTAHHVQIWTTQSVARLARLADFSRRDIWIDASTGLVLRIAYNDHASHSSVPLPVQVNFSNYSTVNGIKYPFSIEKWVNGTPYAAISIGSVAFNVGLTDADFPVE